jgi:uncharacterized membrane protein
MSEESTLNRCLILVFAVGLLLRVSYVNLISLTDEGIYVYLAKEVYLGSKPYRDFFYVHPPLDLYLTASVFRIFGVGIIQARIIPLVFSALTIPLVYKTANDFYDRKHAFLSTLMFSFSYGVVFFTKYALMNSTLLFFTTLSYYLLLKGLQEKANSKLFFSGVCVGIASLSRFFALITLPAILIFLFIRRRKEVARLFTPIILGFALAFSPLLIYFAPYIKQILIFHASKSGYTLIERVKLSLLMITAYYPVIFPLGVSGIYLTLKGRKTDADVLLLSAAALSFAAILTVKYNMPINPPLYFIYASGTFALLGGKIAKTLNKSTAKVVVLLFIAGIGLSHAINFLYISKTIRSFDSDVHATAEYLKTTTTASEMIVAAPYPAMFTAFFAERRIPGNATDITQYRFSPEGTFNEKLFDEAIKEADRIIIMDYKDTGGCSQEFLEKYTLNQHQEPFIKTIQKHLNENYATEKKIGKITIYSNKTKTQPNEEK